MADTLIIGCGYLGRRIATLLLAQNHSVFVTTRSQTRADDFTAQGLHPIVCDVLDPTSLDLLPKVESIIYCVGLDHASGVSMEKLYVTGLANVIQALKAPAPKFLYVSSTSVYGQTEGEEVDESSMTKPEEGSGRVVLEAERALRSKLPSAIILRFAGIYGPGRLMRAKAIRDGEPIICDHEKWLNLIHVEDGASCVVAALARAAQGSLFNVSDNSPVRRGEFYSKMANILGAPKPRFMTPPDGAPPSQRERSNRRIVSRRMLSDLGVRLTYPNYEMGLSKSI